MTDPTPGGNCRGTHADMTNPTPEIEHDVIDTDTLDPSHCLLDNVFRRQCPSCCTYDEKRTSEREPKK